MPSEPRNFQDDRLTTLRGSPPRGDRAQRQLPLQAASSPPPRRDRAGLSLCGFLRPRGTPPGGPSGGLGQMGRIIGLFCNVFLRDLHIGLLQKGGFICPICPTAWLRHPPAAWGRPSAPRTKALILDLVRSRDLNAPQKIGVDLVASLRRCGAWTAIEGF